MSQDLSRVISKRFHLERFRTYNPSVNSRMVYSRLALQTQDLEAQKAGFSGNWGDSGGTHILKRMPMPLELASRLGNDYGLVCYLKPGNRIGDVSKRSIEIICPPPREVRVHFYNPDVEQPWVSRVGSDGKAKRVVSCSEFLSPSRRRAESADVNHRGEQFRVKTENCLVCCSQSPPTLWQNDGCRRKGCTSRDQRREASIY